MKKDLEDLEGEVEGNLRVWTIGSRLELGEEIDGRKAEENGKCLPLVNGGKCDCKVRRSPVRVVVGRWGDGDCLEVSQSAKRLAETAEAESGSSGLGEEQRARLRQR
ncbi:hypothetical protein PM082_024542 [Marasmius tenuissimus]|nr:hypothetical protein PM082_024542 [Marasmius tenuissimus]